MKLIILVFLLFLILLLIFLVFNTFLKVRSKNHSNKFFEKIITKTFLLKVFKPIKRGWHIHTFREDKKIADIRINNLSKIKWFDLDFKDCSGIADPFLFKRGKEYYLFFEYEYYKNLKKGADIAYATSTDGLNWKYQKKIITEPFHQSFPLIFEQGNNVYLLPESNVSNKVPLYVAKEFPNKWELDTVLFTGKRLVDTVLLEMDSIFYWFTTDLDTKELLLYYSKGLKNKWIEHPYSPITNDRKKIRNAGAIYKENGKMYRFSQDSNGGYGAAINMYKIEHIDTLIYKEVVVKEPLLAKSSHGIKDAIHHLSILNDEKGKLIALDGANFSLKGIKLDWK